MAPPRDARRLVPAFALMIAVGPSNYVLYKILFAAYGEASAFFVMQGINLLYCVYGGLALWQVSGEITPAMRRGRKWPFAAMAALDCLGGLCAATGAVDTPGQLQTLLNQSLVPCTMAASVLFLKTTYTRHKIIGAFVILVGACVVVAPELRAASATPGSLWSDRVSSSILVYWGSNVPMALSAVYKEWRFNGEDVHVMYLTQWVSCFQFLFGFAFAPLQCVPGVATPAGLRLKQVGELVLRDSRNVVFGKSPYKTSLMLAYVLNNFVLNVTGLFVTKRGGAALTAILYSVLLPLSTLAFALPVLGEFREPIAPATVAGLVVVLVGFYLYEAADLAAPRPLPAAKPTSVQSETAALVPPSPPGEEQPAFHERLLLVRIPLRGRPRALTEPVETRNDLLRRALRASDSAERHLSEHDHAHLHEHGHVHAHVSPQPGFRNVPTEDPDHRH